MKVIELDASDWSTALDFYQAIFKAIGAPDWYGTNANALMDSMIYGNINAVDPPLQLRCDLSAPVRKEVLQLVPARAGP